jgi:hypothetical protein
LMIIHAKNPFSGKTTALEAPTNDELVPIRCSGTPCFESLRFVQMALETEVSRPKSLQSFTVASLRSFQEPSEQVRGVHTIEIASLFATTPFTGETPLV